MNRAIMLKDGETLISEPDSRQAETAAVGDTHSEGSRRPKGPESYVLSPVDIGEICTMSMPCAMLPESCVLSHTNAISCGKFGC